MPFDSDNIKLSQIIYGSYVKMDRLSKIVYETFANTSISEATHLNIFIDLYSVLHSVFSEHYRVNIENHTDITSGVINMCAHYRQFFKGLGVHTTFYLVFSFNTCELNRKFVAGYNEVFLKKSKIKLFNEVAMNNFDLLNTICPYLPDIHFIKSIYNYESAVIIANLIETINDGNPNLIISRDLYPLQLCALYPYTSYLYPLKSRGEDLSIMVPISEKTNFRHEFWELFKRDKINKTKTDLSEISPLNFAFVCALNGFLHRGVDSIYNILDARKISLRITNGEDIKVSSYQLLNDPEISKIINVEVVDARMKAMDVQFALPYYKLDPEAQYNLINVFDSGAINHINSKYFQNNPLDLQRL